MPALLRKSLQWKKVPPAVVHDFWIRFDANNHASARRKAVPAFISGYHRRFPIPVTPSLLGHVRYFRSRENFRRHISMVSWTNRAGQSTKFSSFNFFPMQIVGVDRSHNRLIERVYAAPNVRDILDGSPRDIAKSSRYGKNLLRILKKRGVSLRLLRKVLTVAINEMKETFSKVPYLDFKASNLLILDIDPVSKKPLLVIIDHFPE